MVDRLLGLTGDPKLDMYNDAYAAWWTLKWSDLIRNQSNDLGEQGMWAFHNWLSESFRSNKPFDQFVRELVTAKGSIYTRRAGQLFPHQHEPGRLCRGDGPALPRRPLAAVPSATITRSRTTDRRTTTPSPRTSPASAAKPSQEFGLFGRESVVIVRAARRSRSIRGRARCSSPSRSMARPPTIPRDRRVRRWRTG